jgi:hypothetical protein
MTQTFMRYLNISTELTPAPTAGTTSKQVLLFGQRLTSGTLIESTGGFTQPNYYVPFLLPSFASGGAALNYLKNYGIQSTIGINFTLSLPAPTTLTPINGTSVLTWSSVPAGFLQLTGFVLSGVLSQMSVNANIISAAIVSGTATIVVYGSPAYIIASSSGTTMTLTGVNNVVYPDPILTDPIALMVWDFYQSALSANSSAFGPPAAYISILSDRDTTINASATPIVLGDPSAVSISGTTTVLTYASSTVGLGWLPTTIYGNTTVTQATSLATGTFDGYAISGSNVLITVTNVTGTFVTSDSVSVTLDNTINGFNYLDQVNLYGAVLQFPINTLTDINTNQAAFYDGIAQINEPDEVLNGHYFTYGAAGNITSLPSQAASLPNANDMEKILVTYPYVYKFGGIPYDNAAGTVASGRVTSAVLYMLANGDAPFPPLMSATINHLPVSSVASTTSYSAAPGGTGDLAVNQGWLPLAPTIGGRVQFLESNTTLTTIPNTSTPDIEFRYTHIWDCVRWVKQEVAQLYEVISVLPNNMGSVLLSPQFINQFRTGIIGILNQGQSLGVLQNVPLYENLVTVTQDTQNPNQVDAYIPTQMIPQLNGASVLINIFSSLVTFTTNNQGG